MGLDASVRCRCWEDGCLKTPPPRPEHVTLDEEGYVNLDLPWDEEHRADHDEFMNWMRSCCPHEDMDFANERIGNWASVRLFQAALQEKGLERFPTLMREIPNANGGLTSPDASAAALDELQAFVDVAGTWFVSVLVDPTDGRELHEYIAAYEGLFTYGGRYNQNLGVDPAGFFVISKPEGTELFRSMAFGQRKLGEDTYEYTDLESGRVVRCHYGVSKPVRWPDGRWEDDQGRIRSVYPELLQVEPRPRTARDLYSVEPLRRIFVASVKTRNPVRWG